MAGAEENREKSHLSLRMNGYFAQKFTNQSRFPNGNAVQEEDDEETDEEIELSLGLSMNGRFGADPARKKLRRSSSISNLVFTVDSMQKGSNSLARGTAFETYAPLVRTSSLPTEVEEEWRRRKELQSMRRMEARKKRMEKLKLVRVGKDKDNGSEDGNGVNGFHEAVDGGGAQAGLENGNVTPPSSIGSLKGLSGNISELQSQLIEGTKQNDDAKSPPSHKSSRERIEQAPPPVRPNSHTKPNGTNDLLKTTFLDMPYVSTKGDGPNGHRIDGFLYRYKKGEEVRIVCVCHGLFLSPAEFIKHGGGGDVEHPLKHIVVNPSPLL